MAQPSAQPSLDLGALFQKSWTVFQRNALVFVLGLIVVCVILAVAGFIASLIGGRFAGIGVALVQGPLALGYFGVALSAARGGTPQFPAIFEGFNRYLPAFLASLAISAPNLVGTLAGGGLIGVVMALVSLVFAFVFCLTYFYMGDKKLDFWPSMQSSQRTVTNAIGPWIVLYLVLIVVNAVAALPCGLGLLITVPMSAVILALAYDQVEGRPTFSGEREPESDYQA
ncbi:MAG: hypothetical protein HUU46_18270 [Candidatus Hydrogenedentes bacterium]|nr:hypothetical protein [Candidatus Hydrogenedentota bacterium]